MSPEAPKTSDQTGPADFSDDMVQSAVDRIEAQVPPAPSSQEELDKLGYYYDGRVNEVVFSAKGELEERATLLVKRAGEVDGVISALTGVGALSDEVKTIAWRVDNDPLSHERSKDELKGIAEKLQGVAGLLNPVIESEVDGLDADLEKLKMIFATKSMELEREDATADSVIQDKLRQIPDERLKLPVTSSENVRAVYAVASKSLEPFKNITNGTKGALEPKRVELKEIIAAIDALTSPLNSDLLREIQTRIIEVAKFEDQDASKLAVTPYVTSELGIIKKAIADSGKLRDMDL